MIKKNIETQREEKNKSEKWGIPTRIKNYYFLSLYTIKHTHIYIQKERKTKENFYYLCAKIATDVFGECCYRWRPGFAKNKIVFLKKKIYIKNLPFNLDDEPEIKEVEEVLREVELG